MRGTDDDGHEAIVGVVLLDLLERARGRRGARRAVDGLVHYHDGLPVPRRVGWMTTMESENVLTSSTEYIAPDSTRSASPRNTRVCRCPSHKCSRNSCLCSLERRRDGERVTLIFSTTHAARRNSVGTDHALYPISAVASTLVANESTADAAASLLPWSLNSAFMLDKCGVK